MQVYKNSETERFFFWLSPNPQEKEITGWLLDYGLKSFKGPQYPTLIRSVEKVVPHETHLRLERVSKSEVENYVEAITRIFDTRPCSFFFKVVDRVALNTFLAYEECTPVSASILAIQRDFAYFGWTATAEVHRGKGGQNALIKARLNRATELGCQIACSETLSLLKASLGNLKKNGFKVVYEKHVFVWEK